MPPRNIKTKRKPYLGICIFMLVSLLLFGLVQMALTGGNNRLMMVPEAEQRLPARPPIRPTGIEQPVDTLKNGTKHAKLPDPLLTTLELLTLQYYSRGKDTYLEWGSGASTQLISFIGKKAYSIDNHKPWCDVLQKIPVVEFWVLNGVLKFICVDTGETQIFGNPVPGSPKDKFHNYMDVLDTIGEPRLDVVLVDGRFRVACGLKALWYTDQASVVMVHDWVEREHVYKALLEFYNVLEQADRLMVLKPKPELDWKRAKEQLDKYSTIVS